MVRIESAFNYLAERLRVSQRKKSMAISSLDESKTQLTPDVQVTDAFALNSESKRGEVPTDATAGESLSVKAWEEWQKRGEGSARPPWWLLLLGVIALSVVYWLWGRGPGVTL
jgi:hypothetical protein